MVVSGHSSDRSGWYDMSDHKGDQRGYDGNDPGGDH